jgi:hypothetical protein
MVGQVIVSRNGGQQAATTDLVAVGMQQGHTFPADDIDGPPTPLFRSFHAGRENVALLTNPSPTAGDGGQEAHFH